MKKTFFILIGLTTFLVCGMAYGQKGNKKHRINEDKIEYVAQKKTEELDKIVILKSQHQKSTVKKLYASHELKVQKLRRSQKGYAKGLQKNIVKYENALDGQIQKQLTSKQKARLKNHKKAQAKLQVQ